MKTFEINSPDASLVVVATNQDEAAKAFVRNYPWYAQFGNVQTFSDLERNAKGFAKGWVTIKEVV